MKEPEPNLQIRQRPSQVVSIRVPTDVLTSLEKVATSRDMSVEALLRLYIGHGLRQDLAKLLSDRVLDTTAAVLARHLQSDEEVSAIMREIRNEVAG
jgi:hypothetical protein